MTNFRTAMAAMTMAAALAGAPAIAGEAQLAAGKPAGVAQAQRGSPNLLIVAGAVVVVVVGVVIATQSSSDPVCGTACTTPATTT